MAPGVAQLGKGRSRWSSARPWKPHLPSVFCGPHGPGNEQEDHGRALAAQVTNTRILGKAWREGVSSPGAEPGGAELWRDSQAGEKTKAEGSSG